MLGKAVYEVYLCSPKEWHQLLSLLGAPCVLDNLQCVTVSSVYTGNCCRCTFCLFLSEPSLGSSPQQFLQLYRWAAFTGLWVLQEPYVNQGQLHVHFLFSVIFHICTLSRIFHLFAQRYEGDVGDLGLTLSYDEDVMGQVWAEDLNSRLQSFINNWTLKTTLFLYSLSAMSWYLEGKPCRWQMKTSMYINIRFQKIVHSSILCLNIPADLWKYRSLNHFLQDQLHPPHGSLPDAHPD